MNQRRAKLWRWGLSGLLALLFCVAPVPAQQNEEDEGPYRQPGLEYRDESTSKVYLDWGLGAVIIVAMLLIAAKNPHRSHLD